MTVDKAVYKCPCCDYVTHFKKALEAHQRHRKHFPPMKAETVKQEPVEAQETTVTETVTVKKTRKPRTKKAVKE